MKMTPKRMVLIIMCVMLLITAVMMAVVIGRFAPVLNALLNPPEATVPEQPSTEPVETDPPTKPTETDPPTAPSQTDPAHEHAYTILKDEQKATCTTAGYSIYMCECGKTVLGDHTEPTGHSYGPGKLVSPKCTKEGYTERKCTVCGEVDKQDVKEPLGHDYVLVEEKSVSCEEDGYMEYKCSACDDIKKENIVKATGHEYEKIETKEPTCTEDGYTVYVCAVCEDEKTDDIVKTDGHDFDPWEVTTDPAAGQPGEETRKCSACSEKETRECELTILDERKMEDTDGWHYIIKVGARNSENKSITVYTYDVFDYGRFGEMDFNYDPESGLIVTFTNDAAQRQTYVLSAGSYSLVIGKDGKQDTSHNGSSDSKPTEGSESTQSSGAAQN